MPQACVLSESLRCRLWPPASPPLPLAISSVSASRNSWPPSLPSGSCLQGTKTAGKRFDFDADPVSWFYQNQIKSEEEFQAKKEALRAEARKRLDAVGGGWLPAVSGRAKGFHELNRYAASL